jgi:hypothetical protein
VTGVDTPGGDWKASALNLAVFRGDADLAHFHLRTAQTGGRRIGMCANSRRGMPIPGEEYEFSPAVAAYFER